MKRPKSLMRILPRTLTFIGFGIVAVCLSIEAAYFPWDVYFGVGDPNLVALDDTAPVVFKASDSDIMIVTQEEYLADPQMVSPSDEATSGEPAETD